MKTKNISKTVLKYSLSIILILSINSFPSKSFAYEDSEIEIQFLSLKSIIKKSRIDNLSNAIRVAINSEFIFEPNSSELKVETNNDFYAVIQNLKKYSKNEIVITIHTDTDGDANLNLLISQKRALALEKLLTKEGIKSNRFKCIGMGEYQPTNFSNSDHKIHNDRIEFLIISK